MRVVVGTHYFAPHVGGIERVAEQHASGLAANGHDVRAVTTAIGGPPGRQTRDGYEVVRYPAANLPERLGVPYPLPSPLRGYRAYRDAARAFDPDVVHLHGLNYLTTALGSFATPASVPVVLHQHTPHVDYDLPWSAIEWANDRAVGRLNLRRADEVVAVSEEIADYVETLAPGADARTLYNGVDLDAFTPDNATEKSALGWDDSKHTFLTVTRLSKKKGIDVLLRAATRLPADDFELVIVGSGPLEDRVREQAGRRPNIEIAGYLGDETLRAYFATADAFVFPSRTGEAFPTLTVIEALASGTPVVATELAERPKGLTRGENALLVPPDDAAELARAMREMTDGDRDANRMGRRARRAAERHFDVDGKVDSLEHIYRELTG